MTRRTLPVRLFLASLAATQMAAPFMATMADAAYARDAVWIGVHIEDQRGPHDHWQHRDDCVFCQFLAQHAIATRAVSRVEASPLVDPRPSDPTWSVLDTPGPFLPDSRAPPTA
jgi:hypothetical protein